MVLSRSTRWMSAAFGDATNAIGDAGAMTIEMFLADTASGSFERTLLRLGGLEIHLKRESAGLSIVVVDGGDSSFYALNRFPQRNMTHLAFTFDERFFRLYVDGALSGSILTDGAWLGLIAGADSLEFNPDRQVRGHLAELAIYKRALTHVEIARHALLGPDAPDDFRSSGSREFALMIRDAKTTTNVLTGATDTAKIGPLLESPADDWSIRNAMDRYLLKFPEFRLPRHLPEFVTAQLQLWSSEIDDPDVEGPTDVSFSQMLTFWDSDVTWINPWSAGPVPSVDFVEPPLRIITKPAGQRDLKFKVDVTPLVTTWLLPDENHGLILESAARRGTLFDSSDQGPDLAPGVLVHGRSDGDLPEEVIDAQATGSYSGAFYTVAIDGPDLADSQHFEIYLDGDLRCVTSSNVCAVDAADAFSNGVIFVVDDFGRIGDSFPIE